MGTYYSFILSFEHAIESKTDNNRDRLHFLQQYTKGPAQELVRSCQLMSEQRGYPKAKGLLHEHYGNEYKVASAYIDKALSWSNIKSEDPKALQTFTLFLRSCCNVIEEMMAQI